MEETMAEDELRLCVVKRENLRKSMETVQSQASDILTLTLQWTDLEEHLLFVESFLEKRSKELEFRAKEVKAAEAKVDDLEILADGFTKEIEEKRKEVVFLKNQAESCLDQSKAEEIRLNQLKKSVEECVVEERLKAREMIEMVESLRKTQGELSVAKEQLFRTQTCRKELEEEIERKTKDLTVIGDGIVESGKKLQLLEERVDIQEKLIVTRSNELISKEKQLENLEESIRILNCGREVSERKIQSLNSLMTEISQQIESKAKELENIQKLVEEQTCELNASLSHHDSIKLLIQEHGEELVIREKKYDEMSEAIHKLEKEIKCKEKTLERAESFIQQLSSKQDVSENKLLLTERDLETTTAELESKKKRIQAMEDTLRKLNQDLKSKGKELDSLKSLITEKKKQVEASEKKLHMRQEESNLIKKTIKESSEELETKKKEHTKVEKSIRDLNVELTTKECKLKSLTKKIQDSFKEFQSRDEQDRLKSSLKEREHELSRKETQLATRSKKIELKEKELDERQEKTDHKNQKLKSTEQKFLKSVKDCGMKTKALSSIYQQSKAGQRSNLLQSAELRDEKSLELLLRGHLKKCPELHVDISSALKASSDPAKLVLDTIQGVQAAQQRMSRTKLDQNGVRWSSIFLLECLMEMPSKPKAEVEEEAIKFAIEWKKTTEVKADNPVEVLSFLHFLAAFSLAFTFDVEKVQNLFDVGFLCKYGPSLCKALGVSALAPISNVLSLDDTLEQLPSQAPINTRSASRSPAVQGIAGPSQLDCEDALMDNEIPASLSQSEVLAGLQLFSDPPRSVLTLVEEALLCTDYQPELGLPESTVKNLVVVLEELTRIPRSIDSRLQLDASKLLSKWNETMKTRTRVSPLEALAFLQFIVAYRLMDRINRDDTLKLALYVAHYKQAPKLFDSLGFTNSISYVVVELLKSHQYVPAIRFMLSFNLETELSPLNLLEKEINGLKGSAMETRQFNPQAEDKDAGKLRDIIELIADFKLEIDLPGDLIAKFVLSQENLNQNQSFVSPVSIPPEVQRQAAHMAAHGPNTSRATNFGTPTPNPEVIDVETYEARGLTPFQGRSTQQQSGFKRPRVEPCVLRPVTRPGFEPPRTDRI